MTTEKYELTFHAVIIYKHVIVITVVICMMYCMHVDYVIFFGSLLGRDGAVQNNLKESSNRIIMKPKITIAHSHADDITVYTAL